MGLPYTKSLKDMFNIEKKDKQYVIALAGNPNTGKSTVFNYLTGLNQHTGNWPGKTVTNARGEFKHNNTEYILVDLPGTYSLFASSVEEVVARDFVCFGKPDAVVVVTDATCLERNLNLLLQIMELTDKVILCINLIDEAKKKNITIDAKGIEKELGIPVVLTAARSGIGMKELKDSIDSVVNNKYEFHNKKILYNNYIENLISQIQPIILKQDIDNSRWISLRILDGDNSIVDSIEQYIGDNSITSIKAISNNINDTVNKTKIRELITEQNYLIAENIKHRYVKENKDKFHRDNKIDNIITSKILGIPIMLLLLGLIFWITIQGANYPSAILGSVLFKFQDKLSYYFTLMNIPKWLDGLLIQGLYRTLAWVVAVMLPPMAIFFPIFTLLEDLGYLPRVAFNLDHLFKKACAHGKQCLTMCMGFGCNAAGVIGCRIIESPRERLIAILTNNFVPCNGRFPILIAISSVFFSISTNRYVSSLFTSLSITILVIIGVIITLLMSYILSKTLLKGVPSSFTLELPPYRKPKIGRVLYSSVINRTIFVLGRAIIVAAPAGAITWLLGNIYIGDSSIIAHLSSLLDPFARIIGLDGIILMAFILGIPANEIVLPIILMAYLSTSSLTDFTSIESLREILINNGWTYLTALNTMLFSLLHWPCSTTLITIKKETGSIKLTVLAALLPTVVAIIVCLITTLIYNLFVFIF